MCLVGLRVTNQQRQSHENVVLGRHAVGMLSMPFSGGRLMHEAARLP
jgi:hypothetical protein